MEQSWQLLFDIALSHGKLLREQAITYDVLLAFLRAAELIGPRTGVYPALIERLWAQHCVPFRPSCDCAAPQLNAPNANNAQSKAAAVVSVQSSSLPQTTLAITAGYSDSVKEVVQVADMHEHGVVRLTGFTDIMNVVSVRCFQSSKCAQLCEGKDASLPIALAHSTENCVQLSESVAFTANTYLQPFIDGNIVHKKSCIRLSPALNSFSSSTNKLVMHVVGTLTVSVVSVLFDRYATHGRLTFTGYERFVRDVFGHTFTAEQYTSALAIFHYKPFADANCKLSKYLEEQVYSASNDDEEHRIVGCTLSFDAFVDALLMLGVVTYADECIHPHHRPVTAKIWSVFEDYLCPAAGLVQMAEDPHWTLLLRDVQPYISYIYPDPIQTDRTSSFIVGGLGIGMTCDSVNTDGETSLPAGSPSFAHHIIIDEHNKGAIQSAIAERLVSSSVPSMPTTSAPESADEGGGSSIKEATDSIRLGNVINEGTLIKTMQQDHVPLALSPPVATSAHTKHSTGTANSIASRCMPDSVARYAFRLFASEFEGCDTEGTASAKGHLGLATAACRGVHEYCVYVDDQCALCSTCGSGHVLVHLSGAMRDMKYYRWAVYLENGANICAIPCTDSGTASAVTVHLTPLRHIAVSVRGVGGAMICSSRKVLLRSTPTIQVLSAEVVQMLCRVFVAGDSTVCARYPPSPPPDGKHEATINFAMFVDICQRLGLVPHGNASTMCKAALAQYTEMACLLDQSATSVDSLTAYPQEHLSFYDFICGIAMIGVQQVRTLSDCPDLNSYLHIALLHHMQHKSSALACEDAIEAKEPAVPIQFSPLVSGDVTQKRCTLIMTPATPYNAQVDVPFTNAIAQKLRAIQESAARREATLATLQTHQSHADVPSRTKSIGRTRRQPHFPHNSLPDFPHGLRTLDFVSQYDGDAQANLLTGVRAACQQLQDAFLTREIVISDNVALPNV